MLQRTGFACGLIMLVVPGPASATADRPDPVRRVAADAPGGGDGLSWGSAFRDLQDGLAAAAADPTISQIWVAAGSYRPDRGTLDRSRAFELLSDVALYGGFGGDETSLEERDPAVHITMLSGDLSANDDNADLNGDGLAEFRNVADNARNVVRATSVSDVLLDGFRIHGGNADYPGEDLRGGGGTFFFAATGTVRNITFQYNSAGTDAPDVGGFGGGLYILGGEVTVENCQLLDNRGMNGGALGVNSRPETYADAIDTVATIVNCVFERNYSEFQNGGAMWSATGDPFDASIVGMITMRSCRIAGSFAEYYAGWVDFNTPSLTVELCEFVRNSAVGYGGGFSHGQTAGVDAEPAHVRQCRFVGNEVGVSSFSFGAAVCIEGAHVVLDACEVAGNIGESIVRNGPFFFGVGKTLTMLNCIVRDNTGTGVVATSTQQLRVVNCTIVNNHCDTLTAGGILCSGSPAQVVNSIAWDNTGTLGGQNGGLVGVTEASYCIVQNLIGFPSGTHNLDVDPLFIDAAAGDLRIGPGSPAIDSGDSAAAHTALLITDIRGEDRFRDDPDTPDTGNGPPPLVDRGAFEHQPGCTLPADFDSDGDVDLADYSILEPNLGTWSGMDPSDGDTDGDADVDLHDFSVLQADFARMCP